MPHRSGVVRGEGGPMAGAGRSAAVPEAVARWLIASGVAWAVLDAVLALTTRQAWTWRAAGALAPPLLAAVWWRAGWGAGRDRPAGWLAPEAVLAAVAVAAAGGPPRAAVLVYVGVGLWAIAAPDLRLAAWAAGAYGAAFALGTAFAPGVHPPSVAAVLSQWTLLVVAAAALQALTAGLAEQRQRVEDARALERARASLAAAAGTGPDGWARAAADAALALTAGDGAAGVFSAGADAGAEVRLMPLAAGRGVAADAVVDWERLSRERRGVLGAGRAVALTAVECAAVVAGGGPLTREVVWAAAVGAGAHPSGLLLLGASRFDASRAEGLAEIAASLTAGLEGAARLERARREAARTAALWRNCAAAVALIDPAGLVRAANPAFQVLLGDGLAPVEGGELRGFVHPEDWVAWHREADADGSAVGIRLRVRHRGGWLPVEARGARQTADPDVRGTVLTLLPAAAGPDTLQDPLTGLPAPALFLDRLDQALVREGGRARSALLLLEVVGEAAVGAQRRIAELVRLDLRERDSACFLGEGRLAVLLEMVGGAPEAARVAERLRERVSAGLDAAVLVGVCLAETAGGHGDQWLEAARDALEDARAAGGLPVERDGANVLPARVRRDLEPALRLAIERKEFAVYYQPTVALDTGRVTAVEALVRWRHPDRGVLAPPEFFAQLEDSGLILPIGWWVLRQACAQVRAWHSRRPAIPPLAVHVNLAVRQLRHPGLVDELGAVLDETGLPLSSLVLEVAAPALHGAADAPGPLLGFVRFVRQQGVRLAVDNFRPQEGSLERLADLGADIVKIDQGILRGATGSVVLGMGRSLNIDVVALGVERREQAVQLHRMGCLLGQGHFFARPLGPAALEAMLARPGGPPEWSSPRAGDPPGSQSAYGG